MTKKQSERMKGAIYSLKRENALKKMILNPHDGLTEVMNESQRRFIYIELPNTNPVIAYAFNENDKIIVGRNPEECTLVINDKKVSRTQCKIFVDKDMVVVQDLEAANPTKYKIGLRKYELGYKEAVPIFQNDILIVGEIHLRVLLLRGDEIILN